MDLTGGNQVVVARLGGGIASGFGARGTGVDSDKVEYRTRGEEGAFVGLGVRRCGRDFDTVVARAKSAKGTGCLES